MDTKEKIIEIRLVEIQNLVAMDEVPDAIMRALDFVRDFSEDQEKVNDIIMFSNQFYNIKSNMNLGLVDYEKIWTKRNQVLRGFLDLIQKVHDLFILKSNTIN